MANKQIKQVYINDTLYDVGANVDKIEASKVFLSDDVTNVETELKKKANQDEVKTKLADMLEDEGHRLVSDEEKQKWNNKADGSTLKDYALKTDIKTKLADLEEDTTHKVVTEEDITKWNAKLDSSIITDNVEGVDTTKILNQKGANSLKKLLDNNTKLLETKISNTDILQDINGSASDKIVSQKVVKTELDAIKSTLGKLDGVPRISVYEQKSNTLYKYKYLLIKINEYVFFNLVDVNDISEVQIPYGFRPYYDVIIPYVNGNRQYNYAVFNLSSTGKFSGSDYNGSNGTYRILNFATMWVTHQ